MKILIIQPKIGWEIMIIFFLIFTQYQKNIKVQVSLLVKDNSRAKDLFSE